MTIHRTHPFAEGERYPMRQFRSRLGGRVSLWAAGVGRDRGGLTVTSMMLVGGDPWRVVGALHTESELLEAMSATGMATVTLLRGGDEYLAEVFAGLAPAPGGPFRLVEFDESDWGPILPDRSWIGLRVESMDEIGWSVLATCTVEHAVINPDPKPLHHVRGRYVSTRDEGRD